MVHQLSPTETIAKQEKTMIISDLKYLEIASEETSIVGGNSGISFVACITAPCPSIDLEIKKFLQSIQNKSHST
jgi:hypothetical protein